MLYNTHQQKKLIIDYMSETKAHSVYMYIQLCFIKNTVFNLQQLTKCCTYSYRNVFQFVLYDLIFMEFDVPIMLSRRVTIPFSYVNVQVPVGRHGLAPWAHCGAGLFSANPCADCGRGSVGAARHVRPGAQHCRRGQLVPPRRATDPGAVTQKRVLARAVLRAARGAAREWGCRGRWRPCRAPLPCRLSSVHGWGQTGLWSLPIGTPA